MAQWFVIRGGKELGPFDAAKLKSLVSSGKLKPDDQIRREDGLARRAGDVKGLFAADSAPTPPGLASIAEVEVMPSKVNWTSVAIGVALLLIVVVRLARVPERGSTTANGVAPDQAEISSGEFDPSLTYCPSPAPQSLTPEFYPYRTGMRRQTVGTQFIGHPDETQMRREYLYGADGVITCTAKTWFLTKLHRDIPLPSPKTYRYRQRGGFVEVGVDLDVSGDTAWSPIVKLGAEVGEQWEIEDPDSGGHMTNRFRLLQIKEEAMSPRGFIPGDKALVATIEEENEVDGRVTTVSEHQFGYNIGFLSKRTWLVENDIRTRISTELLMPTLRE